MISRRALAVPALLSAALCLPSCGSPPQKEMQQAEAAIEAARTAGAGTYAPTELAAAVDALQRSEAAVAQRDYRLALSEALDASQRAEEAKKAAAGQRAALGAEAERAVHDIEAGRDRLRAAVAAADASRSQSRSTRKAVSDARRLLVVANVALQKAREALGSGDFAAATAACAGILEQLNAAATALTRSASPAPTRPVR